MANTFLTPSVIAARGLATLYNTIVLAQLVWRDFDSDFAGKHGDTITIRKPATFTAEEFNQSTGVTMQTATEAGVPLTLNKIANVSFPVTDKEMSLNIEDFSGQLLIPAMEAVAQKIDGDIAEQLVLAAIAQNAVVHIGSGEANAVARNARTILSRKRLPITDRFMVTSPEGTNALLGDKLLIRVNESGSTDALREAQLGRLLGFDAYESQVFGEGTGQRGVADGAAFHRTAVTLAVRPLDSPKGLPASQVSVQNYRSLSMRVTYDYNNRFKQDEVSVDLLYGVARTRDEGAVELDFGQGS